MARLARVVVPGLPHLVMQRGNRDQAVFPAEGDYTVYRDLLAERCRRCDVAVWSYCLMPNSVHLILVPDREDGLRRAIGETHRRYTAFVNARAGVTGHLFQGRFASVAMDEEHLVAAARYVALNPVRARLVARAEDWPWSSARAHLAGRDDELARVRPLLDRYPAFARLLEAPVEDRLLAALRQAEGTGRPLGSKAFVAELEARLGRALGPLKRGPKPKAKSVN